MGTSLWLFAYQSQVPLVLFADFEKINKHAVMNEIDKYQLNEDNASTEINKF